VDSAGFDAERACSIATHHPIHTILIMLNSRISRRRFWLHTGAGAAAAMFTAPLWAQKRPLNPVALATSDRHPETQATVRVRDAAAIRVLQFTDIHFFCGRDDHGAGPDEQSVADMKRMVDRYEPDLVAVTGDTWHDNPGGRSAMFLEYSVRQLEGLGVPWLFTWGNHDLLDDYPAGHDALRVARHSLYRGGPQGGNYTVDLLDTEGRCVWELICLNTTNIGIQRPQREWIDALHAQRSQFGSGTRESTPAFCMLHIPVLQYHYIWEEEMASGFKREAVCSWGENGSGLWHLQRLGNVRALFCGHDHVNDYSGSIEGIELVYGRATGHAGYGGEDVRKGAKLITADAGTGTYSWETVFPDGSRWRPEPGFRTEEIIDAYWMRHRPAFGKGSGKPSEAWVRKGSETSNGNRIHIPPPTYA
jgi:3',5'-cyclic AMP phosphodiesterase CpdA